jgi:hypothetical protein
MYIVEGIWCSRSSDYEEYHFLGLTLCDLLKVNRCFRGTYITSILWSRNKPSMEPAWRLLTRHILRTWRWKRYFPPKRRLAFNSLTNQLTSYNYSSWQAVSYAAAQELPNILWNLKVHYLIHKSPSIVPVLNQNKQVHTTSSYLISVLILSTHLRPGLPSRLFPSVFSANSLHSFLFSLIRAKCRTQLSRTIWHCIPEDSTVQQQLYFNA